MLGGLGRKWNEAIVFAIAGADCESDDAVCSAETEASLAYPTRLMVMKFPTARICHAWRRRGDFPVFSSLVDSWRRRLAFCLATERRYIRECYVERSKVFVAKVFVIFQAFF